MNSISKALLTQLVGVVMVSGLILIMPEKAVAIVAGYCAGIVSLILTFELLALKS